MPDRPWGGQEFRRGPGFRPPWWPENEPFPPRDKGAWPGMGRRFIRRIALGVGLFFGLMFAANALAIAVFGRAFGGGEHRGFGPAVAILVIGALIAFVAARRAVRRVGRPVGDVMEAADRVAGGDYGARVEERGSLEMRRLARSFNAMAERLRANEEQRRNFIADVAHELRTPLSVIQGNAEGMLDGLYPADQEHLEPVLDETRVMARLLDDLQTLSTAEAGALPLHREPVDPAQLVEEAVTAWRSGAEAEGVTLEQRVASGLPSLDVDGVRIGQVLTNLLSNAVRHTPRGGRWSSRPNRPGTGSRWRSRSPTRGRASHPTCLGTSSTASSGGPNRAVRASAWPSPRAWSKRTGGRSLPRARPEGVRRCGSCYQRSADRSALSKPRERVARSRRRDNVSLCLVQRDPFSERALGLVEAPREPEHMGQVRPRVRHLVEVVNALGEGDAISGQPLRLLEVSPARHYEGEGATPSDLRRPVIRGGSFPAHTGESFRLVELPCQSEHPSELRGEGRDERLLSHLEESLDGRPHGRLGALQVTEDLLRQPDPACAGHRADHPPAP